MSFIEDNKWRVRFLAIAETVALWSKDPERKVGCILVSPDGREVSWGYNGFPRGIVDKDDELQNAEAKKALVVHAEANALINHRGDARGWSMFVTTFPCLECAKLISQAGICEVVSRSPDPDSSWWASHQAAMDLFKQTGVKTIFLNETVLNGNS